MDNTMGHELFVIMTKISKIIKKNHPTAKIHPGEFMMLGTIHGCSIKARELDKNSAGISVGELTDKIHATKPAASKMLGSIEDKGYIKRAISPTDRRVVYISLTELGQSIIDEAYSSMHELTDNIVKRMGEEDSVELLSLMYKLYDVICIEMEHHNKENNI